MTSNVINLPNRRRPSVRTLKRRAASLDERSRELDRRSEVLDSMIDRVREGERRLDANLNGHRNAAEESLAQRKANYFSDRLQKEQAASKALEEDVVALQKKIARAKKRAKAKK